MPGDGVSYAKVTLPTGHPPRQDEQRPDGGKERPQDHGYGCSAVIHFHFI